MDPSKVLKREIRAAECAAPAASPTEDIIGESGSDSDSDSSNGSAASTKKVRNSKSFVCSVVPSVD